MNRKTLLAGAVFAGLLVITLFVLRSPEKGTRTGDAPRPIAAIGDGKADTLEITKDGKKTVIKREGSGFKVTEPVAYAADADAAKQAFEAVEKLEFGSIVTDQKSKHDEYEVGSKSTAGGREEGRQGLWPISGWARWPTTRRWCGWRARTRSGRRLARSSGSWTRTSAGWRDKSITTFAQDDAERLEVVSKTGGKIVARPPEQRRRRGRQRRRQCLEGGRVHRQGRAVRQGRADRHGLGPVFVQGQRLRRRGRARRTAAWTPPS